MGLQRKCVRVVQTKNPGILGASNNEGCPIDDMFLECLAVGGIVTNHPVDPAGLTVRCFDIECNDLTADSHSWATRVAENMTSLGFNAVVAPSTI